MSSADQARVACPGCGKKYRWKPELAGRKVQCGCGKVMRMPTTAGGSDAPPSTPAAPAPLPRPASATPSKPAGTPPPRAAQPPREPAPESHDLELNDEPQPAAPPPAKPKPAAASKPPSKPAASKPAPAQPSDDPYELNIDDDEPAAPPPASKPAPAAASATSKSSPSSNCPSCNSPVKPGAVICLNCGFNLKSGTKMQTAVVAGAAAEGSTNATATATAGAATATAPLGGMMAAARAQKLDAAALAADVEKEHRWKEVFLPLICLGVGIVLALLNAFVLYPMSLEAAPANFLTGAKYDATMADTFFSLAFTAVRWVVQIPVMLVSIFVVARLFGSSYGPILTAMLKLAAFALIIGTLGDSVGAGLDIITGGFGGLGWMIKFAVVYGAFWGLAIMLFDMEALEVGVLYILLVIGPWIVMGFLAGLLIAILP